MKAGRESSPSCSDSVAHSHAVLPPPAGLLVSRDKREPSRFGGPARSRRIKRQLSPAPDSRKGPSLHSLSSQRFHQLVSASVCASSTVGVLIVLCNHF